MSQMTKDLNRQIYMAWRKANPPKSFTELALEFNVTRNQVAGTVDRQRDKEDGRPSMGIPRQWEKRTRPLGT